MNALKPKAVKFAVLALSAGALALPSLASAQRGPDHPATLCQFHQGPGNNNCVQPQQQGRGYVQRPPVNGQSVVTQPGYGQPGYGRPGYGQPGYGRPVYTSPTYVQPGYGQPNYRYERRVDVYVDGRLILDNVTRRDAGRITFAYQGRHRVVVVAHGQPYGGAALYSTVYTAPAAGVSVNVSFGTGFNLIFR